MPNSYFADEEELSAFLTELNLKVLKVTGSNDSREVNAACPFCADGKPDHFSVNVVSGLWGCFKCGEQGNLPQLVGRVHELGFIHKKELRDAQTILRKASDNAKAERLRSMMKTTGKKDAIAAAESDPAPSEDALEVLAATVELCERALLTKTPEAKKTRLWLNRRISRAIRKQFRLGLVPADLVDKLGRRFGFAAEVCISAGVANETAHGRVLPRWAGSVLIPTIEDGRVVGLDYRLQDDALIEKFGKYQAQKGAHRRLFNIDAAQGVEEVVICEGQFDTISLTENRFSAVGLPGNATFKEKWAKHLADSGVRCALVLLDNGEEGTTRGRERIRKRLEAVGILVVDIYLPEGVKDANDFFAAGGDKDELLSIIASSKSTTTKDPVESKATKPPSETGKRKGRSKKKPAPSVPTGLPIVCVNARPEREIIGDAWDAAFLAEEKEATLFTRGGKIVRLERRPNGSELQVVSTPWLRGHLGLVADWGSLTDEGFFHSPVREGIVQVMLARPDRRLRPIDRLVRVPVFDHVGGLISESGYIEKERAYLALPDGWRMPTVSNLPTKEEVQAAVHLLTEELLFDFPFKDASDLAHALAAFVLPFARLLIDGPTPFHLAIAPGPGAGKTLLCELIAIVFLGAPINAAVLPEGDEEVRKRITSILMQGNEIVLIDNIDAGVRRDRISSSALAAAATATMWEDRALHSNEMVSVPNKAIWLLTGNNVNFSEEIARRTIHIRIVPIEDNPSQRTGFKHANLKEWAFSNRAKLVHALLTIIRSWLAAGRPEFSGPELGSFVSWRSTIGGILQNAGIDGFLDNLDETLDDSDAESANMEHFVTVWADKFGEDECTVEELHTLCNDEGLLPDVLDGKSGHGGRSSLGRELAKHRHRTYGGFTITPVRDSAHKGRTYRLKQREDEDDPS